MTRKKLHGSTLLVALAASAVAAAGGAGQLSEPLSPRALEDVDGPARCGTLDVAEDPERPGSRRIGLRGAVLPGRSDDATDDAARQLTVPADHHVHVWSEGARDLLMEAQRRIGQAVVGEDEMRVLDGDDVVAALDSAGIRTGVVLSTAYFFGMPDVEVEDEAARVRAENAYVARQLAEHPDRLVGFFSVNPMADYAMDEIEHWADRDAFVGLKLHLGNSDVSLRDADGVARLREVFRRADELGLAVAVHLGGRSEDFGAEDARAFVDQVLPAAPSVPVQVAHMAGPGGLGPGTRASLDVFAEALREHPERTRNLIFDLSGVPNPRYLARGDTALIRRVDALNELFVDAVREVGLDRVVFGTDYPLVAMGRYVEGLRDDLALSDAEVRDLLDDPAPYLR